MNDREIIIALCLHHSIKLHEMLDIPLEQAEACCEFHHSISRKFQAVVINYRDAPNLQNWYWLQREFARAENGILRFLRLLENNHGADSPQLVINFDPPENPPSADYWKKAENQNG